MQLTDVAYQPKAISCRGGGSREIYFNITMVNTTADTVYIDLVHTAAFVKAAFADTLVGKLILQNPKLAFAQPPRLLRSGDGQITFTSILPVACASLGGATDIDVYLYVRTSAGEFASKPSSLGIGY
ncbi:MAG TPA: hypothetical protein VE967_15880 [Gemmatimonadaceae bacterium]|nr:hypothetical protein [Gemmatimonadaceae bacterium]